MERLNDHMIQVLQGDYGCFAFSRWTEDGKSLVGVIILEAGRLRTLHVVEERRLRRAMHKGELLWRS